MEADWKWVAIASSSKLRLGEPCGGNHMLASTTTCKWKKLKGDPGGHVVAFLIAPPLKGAAIGWGIAMLRFENSCVLTYFAM